MKFLTLIFTVFIFVGQANAQNFNCAAGRIIYAKKYTDLFSTFPGTASVVEGCAAVCEQSPKEDRAGCFLLACGFGCLAVGIDNCVKYYTEKTDIDGYKGTVEKICAAENDQKRAREKEADTLAWSLALTKDTEQSYEEYLKDCNKACSNKSLARAKIKEFQRIQDAAAWQAVVLAGSVKTAQDYLDACNKICRYRSNAEKIVSDHFKKLDHETWVVAQATNSMAGYQAYLNACTRLCAHRNDAKRRITEFQKVQDSALWASFDKPISAMDARTYLKSCEPTCRFRQTAQTVVTRAEVLGAERAGLINRRLASMAFFGLTLGKHAVVFLPVLDGTLSRQTR